MNTCERCSRQTYQITMSVFNTDMLCDRCKERERIHPKFKEARAIVLEEISKGNTKFPGPGLPEELKWKD